MNFICRRAADAPCFQAALGLHAVSRLQPVVQAADGIALAEQILLPRVCAALPVGKVGEQGVPMLAALGVG